MSTPVAAERDRRLEFFYGVVHGIPKDEGVSTPMTDRTLKFGLFLPPLHATGQSPTLSLQRDLQLVEHLDRLGFDEAWVGEHHSGGTETIASPEVFIAAAAERTSRIKLGTGVNSLPYHNPFILADRIMMLDHLTRGRMMFGVGPGQLTSDAHMIGIDPNEQRRMMEESFEVIMALFAGRTVTKKTDWFDLRDARLQHRRYSDFEIAVAASISPTGPKLAGRHGVGLMSLAATNPAGFDALAKHWSIMEQQAAANDTTVNRSQWRMVGPVHIAETEKQAIEDVRFGFERSYDYMAHVIPLGETKTDFEGRVNDMKESGLAVIGTVEQAIAQFERLIDQSGGFGTFLVFGGDLADYQQTLRSYELLAQYVMPHFQNQLTPLRESNEWITGADHKFVNQTVAAINKSIKEFAPDGRS